MYTHVICTFPRAQRTRLASSLRDTRYMCRSLRSLTVGRFPEINIYTVLAVIAEINKRQEILYNIFKYPPRMFIVECAGELQEQLQRNSLKTISHARRRDYFSYTIVDVKTTRLSFT